MAYFLRLMPSWAWFVVGCLLAGVPQFALAETTAGQLGTYRRGDGVYAATVASLCNGTKPYFQTDGNYGTAFTGTPLRYDDQYIGDSAGSVSSRQVGWCQFDAGNTSGRITVFERWYCPSGASVAANNTCVYAQLCPDGQTRNAATGQCVSVCTPPMVWDAAAQTCRDPCSQFAGNSYGTSNSWADLNVATMGGTGNTTFCDGQCAVSGGKVECSATTTGSGERLVLGENCIVQGPFVHTGKSCTEAGASPQLTGVQNPSPPWWEAGTDAKKCGESGGYWGSVNGVDTCVRKYPGDGTSTKTTTEGGTETKTTTNPDGSTTKTEESTKTTCEGATCTTTKTTTTGGTNPDGTPKTPETSTSTQEKPKADFCQENPQVAGCDGTKKDGSFGGSCGGGFTCTGDAVQCAIAEQAHKVRCEDEARRTEEQGGAQTFLNSVGPLEISQADADRAKNADGSNDVDVWEAFQQAQQTYVDYAAGCIPDFHFSFKGVDYTIDASIVCSIGEYVRVMMHLLAYMSVLGIMNAAFGGGGGRKA